MRLAFAPTELVQAFSVSRTLALAAAHKLTLDPGTDDAVAAQLDHGDVLGDELSLLSFLLLDPTGERAFIEAARATGHAATPQAYEDQCLALLRDAALSARRTVARVAAAATRAATQVTALLLACDGPRHLSQLGTVGEVRARLQAALADAMGGAPRAHVWTTDDGGLRAHVTWDAPTRRGLPRVASAALAFRPGQPTARVFLLQAHAASDVVRALSVGVFEREDALSFAPLVDLGPLQRLGVKALGVPRSFSHVSEARLIAYEWDSGDDDHQRSTGHDTLRTNERRGHRLDAGTMTWAKLRLTFVQPALRCDVELRRGSVFDVSEPRVFDEVRRLCGFWGLLDEHAARREARPTLFGLEPWSHPDATWARALGREQVDALAGHGVLVPITARVVADPARADAGRVLVTLPLAGEDAVWWGVSDDPTIASRDVPLDDRRTLWLDLRALGKRLARGLGTSTPPAETLARGVVDLGHRKLGAYGLRFVLLARSLGVGRTARSVLDTLRRAALPHPLVVLVPPGCDGGTGQLELHLSSLATDGRDEMRRAVIAAGLDDHVTALELAPPDTRVVVCRRTSTVYVDGVRVDVLGDQQMACLDALIERPGQPVSLDTLGRRLSRHGDAQATAREAKRNLMKAVTRALSAEGREVDDVGGMIATSKGRGYSLAWSAWVRDV